MKHLKIRPVGYMTTAQSPRWDFDPREPVSYDITGIREPILQVEIDKATWDAMFDLYEAHVNGHRHPAIQDAWDQYQMTLHLCGEHYFAGHKKI